MYNKLKILLFCMVALFSIPALLAQEEALDSPLELVYADEQAEHEDAELVYADEQVEDEPAALVYADEQAEDLAIVFGVDEPAVLWDAMVFPDEDEDNRRFMLRNRSFEIVIGAGAHIANDIIPLTGIFRNDVLEIDLQDIVDGFRFNFGTHIAPLSMNVNVRDRFGFGLDIGHVTMTGNMAFPGSVLNFHETQETFGIGAAAFVDFAVPVFFHVRDFRVRVRPALYTTLFHVRPGVVYRFGPVDGGQRLELTYDMSVFSAFDLGELFGDDGSGNFEGIPGRAFGVDLSLDVQYPLFPWLSVGVNITNLPFVPSNVNHYARLRGNMFFDTSYIDFGDIMNEGGLFDYAFDYTMEDPYFGTRANGRRIFRPFSMLFYAEARPFEGLQFITFIPSLGFSINNLYTRPFGLEGGVSARVDLGNILFAMVGINHNDRRWKNSLDFGFDLRAFALGIGISSQSPSFVGSFTGAGIGMNLVLKFGW